MGNVKTAALAALLLVLPVVASAAEAPEPGKGGGPLVCVRPIIHGTNGHGVAVGPNECVVHWAQFQDGWCGYVSSDAREDWPWVGPTMSRFTAAAKAWHVAYGHGC